MTQRSGNTRVDVACNIVAVGRNNYRKFCVDNEKLANGCHCKNLRTIAA